MTSENEAVEGTVTAPEVCECGAHYLSEVGSPEHEADAITMLYNTVVDATQEEFAAFGITLTKLDRTKPDEKANEASGLLLSIVASAFICGGTYKEMVAVAQMEDLLNLSDVFGDLGEMLDEPVNLV